MRYLLTLTLAALCAGCASHRPTTHPLAAEKARAASVASSLSQSQSDGKSVRLALAAASGAAQRAADGSRRVKGHHGSLRTHLDRIDYKLQVLLE